MTELPRLAVITDVPVERTQGGMLLLYRLLAGYPADRLLVVDGPCYQSAGPDVRLPGVEYRRFDYPGQMPARLPGRSLPVWRAWAHTRMDRHAGRLTSFVKDFRPDAVVTVADYLLWIAAARIGLPFHLILHDDHPCKMTGNGVRLWSGLLRQLYSRKLGAVYRRAATRFAVSPGMAERYEKRYGAKASVLYPNRGEDSPVPRVRVRADRNPDAGPVVAFAGALYLAGGIDLLGRLADALAPRGGRVDLYTKLPPHGRLPAGLDRPNVRVAGFLPPKEMAERMGATADTLLLPASFADRERADVATLFPSKLADYTAVGLPILIWGPSYSSAARWGRENPDAAVTVTDPDGRAIEQAVQSVVADRGRAAALAAAAARAGVAYFDAASVRQVFLDAIAAAAGRRPT